MNINTTIFEVLARTDTPTVCNAIELAQGKRGFSAFSRGTHCAMHDNATVAFGYARTATIAAAEPTPRDKAEVQTMRMAYYRYMSEGARPAVCVIEDTDEDTDTAPIGAFWGEVNTNIHKGFGLTGTLTNGLMRDLGACPPDYQVIAAGIGPSHRFVRVESFDAPVRVFGLTIAPDDFVHADRNGACIIPPDILPEIDTWIAKMQALEAIVIAPAQSADFDFPKFEAAWAELEQKRV